MRQAAANKTTEALSALGQSDGLKTLEARLATQNAFNLFDAIGVANQELRHSDFLAFLLRPDKAHGLGDTFLKWFLLHALSASPAPPVLPETLAEWDLNDACVVREWQNVDLFITSPHNNVAVVMENKIHTGEHSGQLSRYMETAKAHGHGENGGVLLGVFLTPHGGKPSHGDYLPIGYEAVCAHLEMLCETGTFSNAKSPDVETTVRHYTRMLRRKIVGDPEITKLCRDLYKEHQAAFDRVFETVQGRGVQKVTTNRVEDIIAQTPGFFFQQTMKHKDVNWVFFVPNSWAGEASLKETPQNIRHLRCIYLAVGTHLNGYQEIVGIVTPCAPKIRQGLVTLINNSENFSFIHQKDTKEPWRCFYSFSLNPEGVSHFSEAWQNWVETEGSKFAALIQPGDFPTS